MLDKKCGKGSGLCPVSFGLAVGVTCALAVLICWLWVMMFGMPVGMTAGHMMPAPTVGGNLMQALVCFAKGFVFGFVVALIYDLCMCCRAKCCGKSCGSGSCEQGPSDKS